jgi:hypothetical protein
MPKPRGREHTSLTETATQVVRVLQRIPDVKMIAPGKIDPMTSRSSNKKFVTIVYTTAGFELLISGQGNQKVAVHTKAPRPVATALRAHKRLQDFIFKERERKPGV